MQALLWTIMFWLLTIPRQDIFDYKFKSFFWMQLLNFEN